MSRSNDFLPMKWDRKTGIRRDDRGAAGIEFALIFPVLILLAISAADAIHAVSIKARLNNAAASVGDLISREESLTKSSVGDIMSVLDDLLLPLDGDRAKISSAAFDIGKGSDPVLKWYEGEASHGRASKISIPDQMMSKDRATVIQVQVSYDFSPTLSLSAFPPVKLHTETYHSVRNGSTQECDDCQAE
ncbi:TadE/TadG family type IV pilus assembly protein [Fulvimarina pelagi]|nr:TadE/TadG family type IV pilus assembly protein [Fulvimarina pelagi]